MPDNFGEILEQIEILRTGQHTASSGKQVEIRPDDLERIAAGYDPKFHEAPVVIGHPENNQPAYGWVKGLRVMGERFPERNRSGVSWVFVAPVSARKTLGAASLAMMTIRTVLERAIIASFLIAMGLPGPAAGGTQSKRGSWAENFFD